MRNAASGGAFEASGFLDFSGAKPPGSHSV